MLNGSGEITVFPDAAAAPEIVKSVHNAQKNVIRIYWRAPETDINGEPLDVNSISGYKINIAQTGTSGESYVLAEKYHTASGYDAAEGLWFYDIDIDSTDYPIQMGTQYDVTITAWRSFQTSDGLSGEVPGASQKPWTIMQNLNLDEDGDWTVDRFPDSSGSGHEDEVDGTLVRVTATVKVSGVTADPTVTITDMMEQEIELTYTSYDADSGALVIEYRVQAGATSSGTYTIRIGGPGCTYLELQDVPMITSLTSIDLDELNGGAFTAYVGDVNGDGIIDGVDKNIVSKNYNKENLGVEGGDINDDGIIDGVDKNLISKNYNKQSVRLVYQAQ